VVVEELEALFGIQDFVHHLRILTFEGFVSLQYFGLGRL